MEPLDHPVLVLAGRDVGLQDDLRGALRLGERMVGTLAVGVGVAVLAANRRANKRFFASMQPLMCFQLPGLSKSPAIITNDKY